MFYRGVFFSIGYGNSHQTAYGSAQGKAISEDGVKEQLVQRLHSLAVKPLFLSDRTSSYNEWTEKGVMAYFSYAELEREGMLAVGNPLKPWARLSEDMLAIAREFHQMYVVVYYAHAFGPSSTNYMHKLASALTKQRRLSKEDKPKERRRREYTLQQSYDEEFNYRINEVEVDLIEDEVEYKRKLHNQDPTAIGKQKSKRGTKPAKSVLNTIKERHYHDLAKKERHFSDEHLHKYEAVLQEVMTTHTGLDAVSSVSTVWLTGVNNDTVLESISRGQTIPGGQTSVNTPFRALFEENGYLFHYNHRKQIEQHTAVQVRPWTTEDDWSRFVAPEVAKNYKIQLERP